MKITKIDKMTADLMQKYKAQKNIKRQREVKGGYEKIVIGTDQDLD